MSRFARACHALLILCLGGRALCAQRVEAGRSGAAVRLELEQGPSFRADSSRASAMHSRVRMNRIPAWAAPLASLAIPGLGQLRLGQDRFVGYLATEGFFLLKYATDSRQAAQSDRQYRQIARDVARRGFVPNPPDTIFQYYEKLSKPQFLESGVFTMALSGPTVPESDSTTYNGSVWLEQRKLYGVRSDDRNSSAYQLALAGYERIAVRQAYRWSWRNAQLEKDIFSRAIDLHDAAARRVSSDVAVLIANHLLSAVDAFAVFRLQQLRSGGIAITGSVPIR